MDPLVLVVPDRGPMNGSMEDLELEMQIEEEELEEEGEEEEDMELVLPASVVSSSFSPATRSPTVPEAHNGDFIRGTTLCICLGLIAHLAATKVGTFMKFEDMSGTSLSKGIGHTSSGSLPLPELACLHEKHRSTMFFC